MIADFFHYLCVLKKTDMIIDQAKIARFKEIVEATHRAAIVCHMSPDGDALGSSLCLMLTLRNMGKNVAVIVPDMYPATLSFLPGASQIIVASANYSLTKSILDRADTIFCLDFNEPLRLDRLAPYVLQSPARRVMIDHHLNPADIAELTFSHPEKSSTCALLFTILEQAGLDSHITPNAAACCCAGMMTDTGNFSYNSNDPDLYRILARLIEKGVNKDAIAKRLFDTSSGRRIRLMGYLLYHNLHMFSQHRCAVVTLNPDEAAEFDYHRGDTESLVNTPLSIPDVIWSVYLRATSPTHVKVSMRSKGDFSVREICATNFGGGGHLNAAGGDFNGTISEALSTLIDIMPLYDKYLPAPDAETFPPIILPNK